jgi:ABC-type dipeptide/oligopeptide/nickel transport system ATPase component
VAASRVTGFVGPNGAGKSTTMRMMVGLTHPGAGDVRYSGVHYRDFKDPARIVGAVLDALHAPGPHGPEPPPGHHRPQRNPVPPCRGGPRGGRARAAGPGGRRQA